ncbi:MAG: ABC transporter permease subunit [Candidatus Hodarchaeales archaeon]|jgi:simple sugar transport system permease protein
MSFTTTIKLSRKLTIPSVSILVAFIFGTITFALMGLDPLNSYWVMITEVMDFSRIADILYNSTPLILTGLSVAVAFRSGMFNIGAEGQLYFGAFLCALVGFSLNTFYNLQLPFFIFIPILIITSAVGGALWALIPAILKARGVHEVITTIMMNHIALGLMIFLVGSPGSPFIAQEYGGGNVAPQSPLIATEGNLPTIFPSSFSSLHWGFIISLIFSVVVFIIIWKTKLGYEGRAVGHNPSAAKYGGINVSRTYIKIMLISGALAGLAGGLEVMGYWHRFLVGFSPGYGFDGIAVALIGGNHPFGVIFGAILFGWLQTSGQILQTIGVPRDVANTLKGYIVFFVAVPLIAKAIIDQLNKSEIIQQFKLEVKKWSRLILVLVVFPGGSFFITLLIVIFFSLILLPILIYSIISGLIGINAFINSIIGLLLLILMSFIYYLFKKKNYPNNSIYYSIWISCGLLGIIESINLIDFMGQALVFTDLILFGLIVLTISFIFYHERKKPDEGNTLFLLLESSLLAFLPILIFSKIIPPLDVIFQSTGLNELIRSTVGIILLILMLFIYYVLKKKNYVNNSLYYSIWISCGLLGIIEYIYLIDLLGQDLVLFGLIVLTISFIFYHEWLAKGLGFNRKITSNNPTSLITDTTENDELQAGKKIYGGISTYFFILLVLITTFGDIALPVSLDLFFFRLNTIGAAIGILGIVSIIGVSLVIMKSSLPPNFSKLSNLPYVYYLILGIFCLQAISAMFKMDTFLLVTMTLGIGAPIGLAALGGMFSEKSGVVNIGLEGMMLTGAFVSVWFSSETGDPWVGVIGAIIAGGLAGLLHAIASIKFRADQVVVGVAINLVATALTTLGLVVVWNVRGTSKTVNGLSNIRLEFLKDLPLIGDFIYQISGGKSGLSPLIYLFLLSIIISAWIIQRTAFGLRVRAVGEHPRAADTVGINVYKLRYICVILSGILAGLGGAALTVGSGEGVIFAKGMTVGNGFIALAALIFGGWNPIGAALASLLFAFATAFRFQLEVLGYGWVILGLRIDRMVMVLPYVITLVAVAIVAKRMRPPAADGVPYVKEEGK